ncbi:acyl-ACP--UDP-N-acetylglucosamine O-acyltransferase [Rickettsiales bacterium]|nr:acyl-ACP--UDP-N-acetylglucosamine O-acyltransferase [Rickettsiales bacterium]
MTQKIHPSAIIDPNAKIGNQVEIGAFSIIGPKVKIGDNNIIKSNVIIDGNTIIGDNNKIFPFAVIGEEPQDLKYNGEDSQIIIGNNNKIREYVTIHPGTKDDNMITKIGDNCLFMISAHIAHDCMIGDNVILANNATLAGHVHIGDNVVIGGLSAIHQFVKIGRFAMIGGMSGVENNVLPFTTVMGERAKLAGLNLIGLKRGQINRNSINAVRKFYKDLFQNDDFNNNLAQSLKELSSDPLIDEMNQFIEQKGKRGICKP